MRGLSQPDPQGIIARLVGSERLDRSARAGLLGRLSVALGASARQAGVAAVASGRWLTDQVIELAPHVPVRDLPTLREHHSGAVTRDDLASALVDAAARATAAVGAAGGVVSSLEMAAPPLLLSSPVQVAAETVAVVAIELKLVAELHEVYDRAAVGTPAVRAAAYLGAWTRRRGLNPLAGSGLSGALGGTARRELRRRVLRRAGSNSVSVVPFLAGAVAGATLNSRETKRLGEQLVRDLGGVPG